MAISFKDIKKLFDPEEWDISVISGEELQRASLYPLKLVAHPFGKNYTNKIHFDILPNTLVMVKKGHTWDYTHYIEGVNILKKSNLNKASWFPIYTNFKEAALLAGLGVRARNSLIYSYKFGFDCHISAVGITEQIVDLPTNRRHNKNLWRRCKGCDDCAKACPVGAIHNDEQPNWLNSTKCDDFIGIGTHDTIPSIKSFWHKNVYPEFSKEEIDSIKTNKDTRDFLRRHNFDPRINNLPFDRNGYTFDGQVVRKDGIAVNIAFCRECTSQPRCSKWGGKFPYNEDIKEIHFYKKI